MNERPFRAGHDVDYIQGGVTKRISPKHEGTNPLVSLMYLAAAGQLIEKALLPSGGPGHCMRDVILRFCDELQIPPGLLGNLLSGLIDHKHWAIFQAHSAGSGTMESITTKLEPDELHRMADQIARNLNLQQDGGGRN
jgi:hypothetical protein